MKIVAQFLERNKVRVKDVFHNMSKEGEIAATSVFPFLQQIFRNQSIHFLRDNKDYFSQDENQSHTQKIIEQFYKTTPEGKSGRFYLYRINFDLEEIKEYLGYWLSIDNTLKVEDSLYNPLNNEPTAVIEQNDKNIGKFPTGLAVDDLRQSSILDNQFLVEQQKIAITVRSYEKEIETLQEMLLRTPENSVDSVQIRNKIESYKHKIAELRSKNQNVRTIQTQSPSSPQLGIEKHSVRSNSQMQKNKKDINLKLLFDFYAKQNHLTGVKASFQRIQHESQTINYQKLVHFLKEFDLFPEKSTDQRKLHNLYVRVCSNTRDLHYRDFLQFLQKYPDLIINSPQESPESRKQLLMQKIQSKSEKNKLLHNPFHSLEKNDFRIDSHDIKYQFKLKPLKGKMQEEVNFQLSERKKQKEEAKLFVTKEKQQKQLRKLKRLMLIDPYNPLVLKNAKLLEEKASPILEPIASLDNMERFRDAKFDMKAKFGISDLDEDPMKQISQRYESKRRVSVIEKEQSERMSSIMSSIIDREEGKLVKLGLSPKKRQASSKHN